MIETTGDADIAGRVVIVTGGSGGVGRTVSARWLSAGASVLVAGRTQATLNDLRDAVAHEPWATRLATVVTDVTTESGAALMVSAAATTFGRPADTLIHLVGGFAMGSLEDPSAPRTWAEMMAVNLDSAFHCYRAMLPVLRARGGGWIVGLGSRAARTGGAKIAAYAAAKAGLVALTQSLSAEVRGAGIHVNLVVASTIDTPANRRDMPAEQPARWVTPDDVADATFYLCSARARAVHGAVLELYATV